MSTASMFRLTTSGPRLPYVLSMAFLICAIASSRGSAPEIAKKHVCMTVLMRPADAGLPGHRRASIAYNRETLVDNELLNLARQLIPHLGWPATAR